eukprot:572281-Hanusia_phi.AAC.1
MCTVVTVAAARPGLPVPRPPPAADRVGSGDGPARRDRQPDSNTVTHGSDTVGPVTGHGILRL